MATKDTTPLPSSPWDEKNPNDPGHVTPGPIPPPVDVTNLTQDQQNWYDTLLAIYTQYGLGDLAPVLLGIVQQGITDADTVEVLLRENPVFKQRFAANTIRQQKGLNALSISQYLSLENEYAAIMGGSGLPQGFYDNRADFTNWIAGDVSPDEVRTRVGMAQQAVASSDQAIRDALAQYHNLGPGDLAAYFLDQNRATSLFETQRTFGQAQVGAAAIRQGLTISGARAQQFADQGVTADQANTGFGNVAAVTPRASQLGDIYGNQYTQADAENEFLGGLASAQRKRQQLAVQEESSFSGNVGSTTSKALRKRTSGAY